MEDLQKELKEEVQNWIRRTFNAIPLDVVTGYAKSEQWELHEYIRYKDNEFVVEDFLEERDDSFFVREFLDYADSDYSLEDYQDINAGIKESIQKAYGHWDEFVEFMTETYYGELEEFKYSQDNYPAWNTLFEFSDTIWAQEKDLEKAMQLGIGVIDEMGSLNTMLFFTSAGHSFYSSYWIPLYLSLNETAQKKYADVDYSGL